MIMEVELCDSYFRFKLQSHLFAKKTTGIWGTCTVCSHQQVFHIVKLPQQETARCLAFCVSTLFILCSSIRGSRLFGERWNISVLQQHIAIKLLFSPFSVMDIISSVTPRMRSVLDSNFLVQMDWIGPLSIYPFVVDIHQGEATLHVQVFVSSLKCLDLSSICTLCEDLIL